MGRLVYDSTTNINVDDRALAHLQIVIGAKLRRGESFPFLWKAADPLGGGVNSLWMAPGISLHFKYFGSRPPNINYDWLDALIRTSNSDAGLRLLDEPLPSSIIHGDGEQQDVAEEEV